MMCHFNNFTHRFVKYEGMVWFNSVVCVIKIINHRKYCIESLAKFGSNSHGQIADAPNVGVRILKTDKSTTEPSEVHSWTSIIDLTNFYINTFQSAKSVSKFPCDLIRCIFIYSKIPCNRWINILPAINEEVLLVCECDHIQRNPPWHKVTLFSKWRVAMQEIISLDGFKYDREGEYCVPYNYTLRCCRMKQAKSTNIKPYYRYEDECRERLKKELLSQLIYKHGLWES